MLIPSIDLMGGKIVQLIQGERKALEFDDFDYWIERFKKYPLVQLIDLDAAMQRGDNRELVAYFSQRLPCQLGGGIRSLESVDAMLQLGVHRVILGSSLLRDGNVDTDFAQSLAATFGSHRLVFAVDSRHGQVAIEGWRQPTSLTPAEMMNELEPWCGAFLYTHIDTEGLLQGIPMTIVRPLRAATDRQLIVAGGIRSLQEVATLESMNIDAVVGMAIYTNQIPA